LGAARVASSFRSQVFGSVPSVLTGICASASAAAAEIAAVTSHRVIAMGSPLFKPAGANDARNELSIH
jgi:hypothetical protein